MFEQQTKESILKRMLDASPEELDKRQGSVTFDLLSPAAIELAHAYIQLEQVLTFGFAGPAQPGEFLDKRCREIGLSRRPGVKASGKVTFTGKKDTTIPAGVEVSTEGENPVYFVTKEQGIITADTVTVAAEAKAEGRSGNVAAGMIKLTTGNITGIISVTNQTVFINGADIESDESLLQRYYDRLQRPSTSGNVWHYRQWALEVAGIGDVKVTPVWNGNGTVKVTLLSDDKRAPIPSLVDAVRTNIEKYRPVGAQVTVVPAVEFPVHVSAKLKVNKAGTAAEVTAAFTKGLTQYLAELAFKEPIVRHTRIGAILLNVPYMIDFSELKINGGTANLEVPEGQAAVAGTVSFLES
ncbi:baseplate J/gp47 family protein [Ectobacillus ponti]|uniref:Baseplate J/gp47 family protein n=1 Tax=Ectobacillus ponti TaxID=2961894 RepID=A0AA41XBT6_9BACI|nr:baseplate J/gp47 family protein [Ectobacillus ponti]MCP8970050.1 baseplate J/gp47 family protein [Ectobacillus ponti]